MPTPQYTNRFEVYQKDPRSWDYINADAPASADKPQFPPGASGPTAGPSETPDAPHAGPQIEQKDPRLGVRPQDQWDVDAMQTMFPEMFLQLPEAPWQQAGWGNLPAEERSRQLDAAQSKLGTEKARLGYDKAPSSDVAAQMGGVGGAQEAVFQPPEQLNRNKFESIVFDQIERVTGIRNPFMYNPYDEVVKADAQLPELFNSYFRGYAVWSDLPRLDKEKKAAWEEIKRQHHARVYNAAKAKKEQATQMYKWMMEKFDLENKAELANQAREQRRIASAQAKSGKGPTFRPLLSERNPGTMTLHQYDPRTGEWVDTGKRTGLASMEDDMPPQVKQAMDFVKKFSPKMDPMMSMLVTLKPELADTILGGMQQSPQMKAQIDAATKIIADWAEQRFAPAKIMQTQDVPAGGGGRSEEDAAAALVQAAKTGKRITAQDIANFYAAYGPNPKTAGFIAQYVPEFLNQALPNQPPSTAPGAAPAPEKVDKNGTKGTPASEVPAAPVGAPTQPAQGFDWPPMPSEEEKSAAAEKTKKVRAEQQLNAALQDAKLYMDRYSSLTKGEKDKVLEEVRKNPSKYKEIVEKAVRQKKGE